MAKTHGQGLRSSSVRLMLRMHLAPPVKELWMSTLVRDLSKAEAMRSKYHVYIATRPRTTNSTLNLPARHAPKHLPHAHAYPK